MDDQQAGLLSKFASDEVSNQILAEQIAKIYKTAKERTLTKAEIQALKAAQQILKERTDAALAEASSLTPGGRTLTTIKAVVSYLQEGGWKVKKSTVYNHAKQRKIIPLSDGTYASDEVDRYAGLYLQPLDGSPVTTADTDIDRIQRETLEAKLRIAQEQARHWEKRNRDLEAELKAIVGKELAVRIRFFRSDIQNFFRGEVLAIVALVAGDPSKAPELNDYLDGQLEVWLGRLSEEKDIAVPPLPDPRRTP